ncbi:MAG: tetratricopeptide repeat protein [Trueperaceae bacterium]
MRYYPFNIRASLTALLIVAGAALAQQAPLPAAAQDALDQGRAAMNQALSTYEAQYPDRALWQEAFRHGRRAQTLAPEHPEPQLFLAEAYSRSNWFGPAWNAWLAYLDQGNLLDADATPLFSEVGSQQGYNYYRQGRLSDAADVYRRIIDEVPFDLEAHTWMGRLLIEMGQPEQAISYWQTVVDRNPGDSRAAYFLELARDQSRWGTEAVNAFRQGVEFHEQGALERARERFARATTHNSRFPDAWAWLGRVAFERGDYADARTFYERASSLAPSNQTYSYFREESERRVETGVGGARGTPDVDGAEGARGADGAEGAPAVDGAEGNDRTP